jgi:hypothetical protein
MNQPKMKIHVEIRSPKGARKHDLAFHSADVKLYDVLVSMSQKPWGHDLFTVTEERVDQIPGYLMVLDNRMVQKWEVDEVPVKDGQQLKSVKVVPGG